MHRMRSTIGPEKRTRSLHRQLPDVRMRRYFKRASRIHILRQFYPAPVSLTAENSDRQTRRLLIGGYDGAVVFRVWENPGEHTRGRARSRFDPRMIIRRQVISGSRYTGGVMGKTITLLSYPLSGFIRFGPCLRACPRAYVRCIVLVYPRVSHALGVGSRSFHVFTSVDLSSDQNITRIRNGLVGPSN